MKGEFFALYFLALLVFTLSCSKTPESGSSSSSSSSVSSSSSLSVCFAKTYGGSDWDWASFTRQTSDGGYIVGGHTKSFGAGNYDCWILKLDSSGVIQWQKAYGGTDNDYLYSIQQTSDGGYIVGGYTKSFGAGNYDCWILKLDSSGVIQWQKTYGGSDVDYAFSIQQTSDGGYIVAGETKSFGIVTNDCWIIKIDSNGVVQWQKTYGGSDEDYVVSIQQVSDGGYIVGGYTKSFGAGNYDCWILKLDSSGVIQWQKTYGGSYEDLAYSIQQISDGGYIVGGYTRSFGAGNYDSWILKLDSSGVIQWQKTYGGSDEDVAYSILQTSDGGYTVGGLTKSFGAGNYDWWILKLPSDGNLPNLSSNTLVTPSDTSCTTNDTSCTVNNTSASVVDTSCIVQDTSAIVQQQLP
ncbi:MAG: hypothetical protein ACP5QT_04755 [Brevinematia bacterium]